MDVLWNNRLCLFHLVFIGHVRDLKESEPPQRLLQGSAVPTVGASAGPRPGRCSCLRNMVPLPSSYDNLLIQKYFLESSPGTCLSSKGAMMELQRTFPGEVLALQGGNPEYDQWLAPHQPPLLL